MDGLCRAETCAPPNPFYAFGIQRDMVLCVSLQVRHCCLLPAKRHCVAKSQYDTACSWKLQKGAAGCESVRRGARQDGGGAWEGAGMPLTEPACLPFHLLLPDRLHLHEDCLHIFCSPSPLCLRYDTCLLKNIIS